MTAAGHGLNAVAPDAEAFFTSRAQLDLGTSLTHRKPRCPVVLRTSCPWRAAGR